MLTTMLAAAGPSKIPFYIAGGLLVVWAVALAGVGLTRPTFPYTAFGQRGVMAISLLFAVLAIGFAIATS